MVVREKKLPQSCPWTKSSQKLKTLDEPVWWRTWCQTKVKLDVGAEVEVRRENSTLSNFFKVFFSLGNQARLVHVKNALKLEDARKVWLKWNWNWWSWCKELRDKQIFNWTYPTIAHHIQHYQTISKAFAVWPIKIGWCDEECAHAKEFGSNKSEFGRRGSNWVRSFFAQLVQTFNLCSKKVFALLTKRTRWMVWWRMRLSWKLPEKFWAQTKVELDELN